MNETTLIHTVLASPNFNPGRTFPLSRITIHCAVGLISGKRIAELFANPSRNASSNYCIGKDGDIFLSVYEDNRAWTSGSRDNDNRAITIECASDPKNKNAFPDATYKSLIELVLDLMQRYQKTKLVYIPDKKTALAYQPKGDEFLLTFHRWFENVACPDEWFMNKVPEFVEYINSCFDDLSNKPSEPVNASNRIYSVQIGAFRERENAEKTLKDAKKKGFTDAYIYIKETIC